MKRGTSVQNHRKSHIRTQCMPRERATAFALIREANISGRRRAGTGPAPSEKDRTYLVKQASIRFGEVRYRETNKTKFLRGDLTYRTVPTTARVPEYAARAFHVKDKESNSIDKAFFHTNIRSLC